MCSWTPQLPSTPIDLTFILFMIAVVASAVLNLVSPSIAIFGVRQIVRLYCFVLCGRVFGSAQNADPANNPHSLCYRRLRVAPRDNSSGHPRIARCVPLALGDEILRKHSAHVAFSNLGAGPARFRHHGSLRPAGTFLAFFGCIALGFVYEAKKHVEHKWIGALLLVILPAFGAYLFALLMVWFFARLPCDRLVGETRPAASPPHSSLRGHRRLCLYLRRRRSALLGRRAGANGRRTFLRSVLAREHQGRILRFGRIYWWINTPLVVVRSSPFFGVGPGQFGGGAAAALHNTTAYRQARLAVRRLPAPMARSIAIGCRFGARPARSASSSIWR